MHSFSSLLFNSLLSPKLLHRLLFKSVKKKREKKKPPYLQTTEQKRFIVLLVCFSLPLPSLFHVRLTCSVQLATGCSLRSLCMVSFRPLHSATKWAFTSCQRWAMGTGGGGQRAGVAFSLLRCLHLISKLFLWLCTLIGTKLSLSSSQWVPAMQVGGLG